MKRAFFFAVLASMALSGAAFAQQANALGSVTINRKVLADGKPLSAGSYQVRLTMEDARPTAVGQAPEQWVEFVRGGKVIGREVATIIPDNEIGQIAKGAKPAKNGSRVELLKGNDYVRVWINRGGNNYLIHMPPA